MRWARLRRRIVLSTAILEPMLECVPLGLIGVASLAAVFPQHCEGHRLRLFGLHVASWLVADSCLYHLVTGTPLTPLSLPAAGAWLRSWLLRESGTMVMSLHGFASNKVLWRGAEFELARDAVVIVPEGKKP